MRGFIKKRLGSHIKDQQGFTLIEMLVVIGIIVALAAVIVPLVIQFSGEGAQASADAEWDAVQTTIDVMMADQEMAAVEPNTTAAIITDTGTDFALLTATQYIAEYTRDAATNYCYEWDGTGRLTEQSEWDGSTCGTVVNTG